LDRYAVWWRGHDDVVYAIFSTACVVYAASVFYGYMLVQTGGVWSAPLDDVFIHFDYARSFSRGFPFQWSEGNGYSSGNTSLTYPMVLALGHWLGFRQLNLMIWAALVAVASIVVFLITVGQLVTAGGSPQRHRWARFLIPPAVLSMGALDWTLFSGMENAFHLASWGLCLWGTLRLCAASQQRSVDKWAWVVGGLGALLIGTRPESAVCVATFGLYCAISTHRSGVARGWRASLKVLFAVGAPGVALLIVHALLNVTLTGEWSANGAIAKLFLNNPFMTAAERWERYRSLIGYVVNRLTDHHFGVPAPVGMLIPIVAAVPLLSRKLRPSALLMWSQIVAWMLLVSLNNQVRWHNGRYAMPAVAWLMVLAALGVATVTERGQATAKVKDWLSRSWPARLALGVAIVGAYWYGQAPRMKDQIWFFGRACRNILDQHVTAGLLLKRMNVRRVLVGDAGALIYMSDRPGLDLIGLGGYHDYPFARSTVHGLGASLELIERIPVGERPDVMAIYPSWWGDLPTYFGNYLTSVPVRGNVICGGAEKVLYRANWAPLDRRGSPRSMRDGERIIDQLDIADLMSERYHDYQFPRPGMGFVHYRVLADPADPRRDLFDAGRIIPAGASERASINTPPNGGRLIVRVAPDKPLKTRVTVAGTEVGVIEAQPGDGVWQEVSVDLPGGAGGQAPLILTAADNESVHYHVWVVGR